MQVRPIRIRARSRDMSSAESDKMHDVKATVTSQRARPMSLASVMGAANGGARATSTDAIPI